MGPQDYSSTGGGLKLKGAKPAGVEKKKKKKSSTSLTSSTKDTTKDDPSSSTPASRIHAEGDAPDAIRTKDTKPPDELEDDKAAAREELNAIHKTETEMRHEEMRRRRLNDRLRREGAKTHKERVEELNKYLSGLSEHHDMPRIGPG